MLRVEVRRRYRTLRLADGAVIEPGDRVGALHLDNERVAALHAAGLTPLATGLAFRRQALASLHTLARLAAPEGRLAHVTAYSAITIFHVGLARLGFEVEPDGLVWPRLTAAYQRALLASLHPFGRLRLRKRAYRRARRLWISRGKLLALYGSARVA